ncbi:hypothetical protein ABIB68_007196 [Bradyrhizobium sp. F1.2.2]
MRKALKTILAGWILSTAPAFGSDTSVYTLTAGAECVDRFREQLGGWNCPGPAGYSAKFFDEGNLAAVVIQPPGRGDRSRGYAWRGAGKVFGDRVEWLLTGGAPHAAILRIWRAEGSVTIQELVVFKLIPGGFCRIASFDAGRPGANYLAREEASLASGRKCRDEDELH